MAILKQSLKTEYLAMVRRPLEYHGYFGGFDSDDDLREMKLDGANCLSPNNIIYVPDSEMKDRTDVKYYVPDSKFDEIRKHYEKLNGEMSFNICLGSWNNGLFPYYEDWFYQKYPDICMKDQNDQLIMASMFNDRKPWVNIESKHLYNQLESYLKDMTEKLKDLDKLIYWVNGGEMLYASYCFPELLTDYSEPARLHFKAWLKEKYNNIEILNKRWGGEFSSFAEVEPPRKWTVDIRTLDWHHFRMQSMAEFFSFNYRCIRAVDKDRPIFNIFHGDIFHDNTYAEMGESVQLMGTATDGYATSQILCNAHKPNFNYLYLRMMSSLGKPVTCQALANVSYVKDSVTNDSFTAWDARKSIYECLGMGAWHVGLVQWKGSLPDGDWQIYGKDVHREVKKIFSEIFKAGDYFEYMSAIAPEVGVYVPEAQWLLKGWSKEWDQFVEQAIKHNINYRYVFDKDINDITLNTWCKYLICFCTTAIENEMLDCLTEFTKAGGRLVIIQEDTDNSQFLMDNSRLGFCTQPQFMEGLEYSEELFGRALVGNKSFGKGEVLYYKSILECAMLDRIFYFRPTMTDFFFRDMLKNIEQQAILRPFRQTDDNENVQLFTLTDGTNIGLVIINNNTESMEIRLAADERIALGSSSWGKIIDLIDNKEIPSELLEFEVLVEGKSTKLIFLETECSVNSNVGQIKSKIDILKSNGFDTKVAEEFLYNVSNRSMLNCKENAILSMISSLVYVKQQVSGDLLQIEVADINMERLKAKIQLSATQFMWFSELIHAEEGTAVIEHFDKIQIRYYDHLKCEYVSIPASKTDIDIRVWSGELYGKAQLMPVK